jgi:hypothetical protein
MRKHILLPKGHRFIHMPHFKIGKVGKGYAGAKKKDVQSSKPAITGFGGKRIHPLKFKL